MTYLIPIALLGWIPISIVLLAVLPAQRAVVAGIVGAWLLLPPAVIPISGLPDYDKMMAATLGIMLGTLVLQPNRLLEFRPRWFDLPMVCWCLCPAISSLDNGLGLYDGLSAAFGNTVRWGLPYLVGRLYFGDLQGFRDLTIGIVIGALAYVPPTAFEIRMSPMLRGMVYGMPIWVGFRFGGYRPNVFLANGLEHGMWMTVASLTAVWLWKCGALKRIALLPVGSVLLPILLITTVLCRSTGALVLLLAGLLILWLSTRSNSKLYLYALLLVTPTYYALRIPNLWSGQNLVSFIEEYLDPERAESLGFRFACERMLADKAMQQPTWGWGAWGGNRVIGPDGRDQAPTDGMWIIYLGCYGFVGLSAWTTVMLLPALLFVRRFPVRLWASPKFAPMAAMATLMGLYTIDCLLNGFINLILVVASGGLICAVPSDSKRRGSVDDFSEGAPLARPLRPRSGLPEANSSRAMLTDSSAQLTVPETPVPASSQERLADRYQRLARALKEQGSSAEARVAWINALDLLAEVASIHPDLPGIQRQRWNCANDLAWFLINEPDPTVGDLQLAIRLASQTTEVDPEAAAYWNTLGAAYYRAGDDASAITALERSVTLTGGGTGFDFLFLTLAHSRLGQYEQANHWKAQTDLWMEQHEIHHPELSRLRVQAGASLTCKPKCSTPVS